jgi:hypothetical protein
MFGADALDATLFSGDPLLVPGVLLVLALAAALAASVRRRHWAGRGRRVVVAGYAAVAFLALLVAGGCAVQRAQLFWGVHWEDDRRVLVLDRLSPLPDVRIARADVSGITEITAPERSLAGNRASAQFVVRTRGGADYWSAPVYRRGDAERARAQLVAGPGRLERFTIGSSLP